MAMVMEMGMTMGPPTWNGMQQRRNSWQDGVYGTNCPIPPGMNFTYMLQVKDQIGSFFYYPSLAFHKAAGAFGGIIIQCHPGIPVPFPPPSGDFTILAGDWYKNHNDPGAILDGGSALPAPDGILINGYGWNGYTFSQPGRYIHQRQTEICGQQCLIYPCKHLIKSSRSVQNLWPV